MRQDLAEVHELLWYADEEGIVVLGERPGFAGALL
jgi:hypothetical protein